MAGPISLWQDATPFRRALLVGVPTVVIGLVAVAAVLMAPGGGDTPEQVMAPTRVAPTATPKPDPWLVLAYLNAIAPTATPAPAAASSGPRNPTSGAAPAQVYVPKPAGTGPGPITGTDMSISIPSIGVNASVYARSVGTNGQMGNPAGAWDVIWYDFSQNWSSLGGYPGTGTSNAVFAGHVDYIRVGPAVFWSVSKLVAGDQITVQSANGPITYAVQWSQWAGPADDFTSFVGQTGQDAITLVTCIGGFSGGHYSNRLIVRGIRI